MRQWHINATEDEPQSSVSNLRRVCVLTKIRSSCVLGEHFTCQSNCIDGLKSDAPPPTYPSSHNKMSRVVVRFTRKESFVWVGTGFNLHKCVLQPRLMLKVVTINYSFLQGISCTQSHSLFPVSGQQHSLSPAHAVTSPLSTEE